MLSTLLMVLGSQDVITLSSLLETALTNHPGDMACKETQDHTTHTTHKTSPSMLRQKICQVLLDAGADPWQCLKQDTPWRKSNQGFKNIPLWCVAAARDDPSLLKMLLSFESKSAPCKDTAHQFLHWLIERIGSDRIGYPQQETMELLRQFGVLHLDQKNSEGLTPLHLLVRLNSTSAHCAVLKSDGTSQINRTPVGVFAGQLLDLGANPHIPSSGELMTLYEEVKRLPSELGWAAVFAEHT